MAGFAEKGAIKSGVTSLARFCRGSLSPEARQPYRHAGRLQVGAGCFSTHTIGLLDAPQRPSELPQCDDLLLFFFAQDIAHAEGAYMRSLRSQCPGLLLLAGFQVTFIGRFWVTPADREKSPIQKLTAVLKNSLSRNYQPAYLLITSM